MKKELVKLWREYLKALDEYDQDPYRSHTNFWDIEEHLDFVSFMKWLDNS